MLFGVGKDLMETIVHLDQAATIPLERGRMRISLSETPLQLYSTKRKRHEKTILSYLMKSRGSMKISCIQTCKKKSILVHSTPRIVKKVWTRLPHFKKCRTHV